ncbi:uncharacterized protein VTP21DRAFT_7315 [Calcarisporiella thermophila]|uniref:uncharacterized protein n=1 Tax=Calcarisporiella thermophila TaxID=911321 RepID=UPI003741FA81
MDRSDETRREDDFFEMPERRDFGSFFAETEREFERELEREFERARAAFGSMLNTMFMGAFLPIFRPDLWYSDSDYNRLYYPPPSLRITSRDDESEKGRFLERIARRLRRPTPLSGFDILFGWNAPWGPEADHEKLEAIKAARDPESFVDIFLKRESPFYQNPGNEEKLNSNGWNAPGETSYRASSHRCVRHPDGREEVIVSTTENGVTRTSRRVRYADGTVEETEETSAGQSSLPIAASQWEVEEQTRKIPQRHPVIVKEVKDEELSLLSRIWRGMI